MGAPDVEVRDECDNDNHDREHRRRNPLRREDADKSQSSQTGEPREIPPLERGIVAEKEEEKTRAAKRDPQTDEDSEDVVPHLFLSITPAAGGAGPLKRFEWLQRGTSGDYWASAPAELGFRPGEGHQSGCRTTT